MSPSIPPPRTAIYQAESNPSVPTSRAELVDKSTIDSSICGWIGGKSDSPAICSAGSRCVRDYLHKYVGCCEKTGPCSVGIYTSCVDRNSIEWSPPQAKQPNGIYTCSWDHQCYSNSYAGGYSQYGCGKSSWATQVETTYTGQPPEVTLQLIFTAVTFSAMPTKLSSMSSIIYTKNSSSIPYLPSSSASASISTSPIPPFPSIPFVDNMKSNGIHPGTLASIIIGSLNGVVVLAALAFCIIHRRRRIRLRPYVSPETRSKFGTELNISSPLERISQLTPLRNILTRRYTESPPSYHYPEVAIPAPYNSPTMSSSNQPMSLKNTAFQTGDFSRSISEAISSIPADANSKETGTGPGIGIAISFDEQSLIKSIPTIEQTQNETNDENLNSLTSSDIYNGASPNPVIGMDRTANRMTFYTEDDEDDEGEEDEEDEDEDEYDYEDEDDYIPSTSSSRNVISVGREYNSSKLYHLVKQEINDGASSSQS